MDKDTFFDEVLNYRILLWQNKIECLRHTVLKSLSSRLTEFIMADFSGPKVDHQPYQLSARQVNTFVYMYLFLIKI